MEDNFKKFMEFVDHIRTNSKTFVGFTKELRQDRLLYESFYEKLIDNNLIESSNDNKWIVKAKHSLMEISDKSLKNLFEGKEERKPLKEAFAEFKKGFWGELGKVTVKAIILALGFLVVLLGWDKCSTQKKEHLNSTLTQRQKPFQKNWVVFTFNFTSQYHNVLFP
jgi:hypothetical protein